MGYEKKNNNIVFPENIKYFKEFDINHNIDLNCINKMIYRIISISSTATIGDVEVVKKVINIVNDMGSYKACKLAVEVKVSELIKYIAYEKSNELEVMKNQEVKNIFITIPIEHDGENAIDLLRKRKIKVIPYIEDVYSVLGEKNNININLAVFVNVEFI